MLPKSVLAATTRSMRRASEILGLDPDLEQLLLVPYRELNLHCSILGNDGSRHTFVGHRVHHHAFRGPMLGPLIYHPQVTRARYIIIIVIDYSFRS